jgi:hypothetical protein
MVTMIVIIIIAPFFETMLYFLGQADLEIAII